MEIELKRRDHMTVEQMKLTGVWADILAVRQKLMDAQNEIAQILAVLEAMDGMEETENG